MSLQEIKKQKTALKAIEAIKRIQDGKPNLRKLLNRDNLKLNQHTVEQEAGLSVGALKHHDDILTMISDINLMGCEQEKTTGTQTDIYLLKQEIIKLKAQKKAAITGKKDAIALKKSYAEQLPVGKQLSQYDFSEVKGVTAQQLEQKISKLDWLRQGHNLILFGASGLGKTHLAAAIGHGLIAQSKRVKFTNSTALVQQLQKAREALNLNETLKKLDKYELLILDDIGYVKKSDSESQVLFELIAHRYERNSLLITTNQAFSEWDSIFGDNMMTVAAIDRLVHHADIYKIEGDSYRRKEALKLNQKNRPS